MHEGVVSRNRRRLLVLDGFHSFLIVVICFDKGYVGKQPLACKKYCALHFVKELQESMDRCTGRCNITEILLKTAVNTKKAII